MMRISESLQSSPGSLESQTVELQGVVYCKRNLGDRKYQEDEFCAGVLHGDDDNRVVYAGVFDGHAGGSVSQLCASRLGSDLAQRLPSGAAGAAVMEGVLRAIIAGWDAEACSELAADVGSATVIALVDSKAITVAHTGDSRAVLCRAGIALQLTYDHKPDVAAERLRIESLPDGSVLCWDGVPRVQGMLAMSRAVGDLYLKPFVSAEPDVCRVKRASSDEFLIIASDGLWDLMTSADAVMIVMRCLEHSAKVEAREDTETGMARARGFRAARNALIRMVTGFSDNMTILIVDLLL